MLPVPPYSQIELTQGLLSKLIQDVSRLSPNCQALVYSEVDRFSNRLTQLLSMSDHPNQSEFLPGVDASLPMEEGRLGVVLKGAHAGIWVWDLEKNISTWSPELRELLGVDQNEPSSNANFMTMLHPEDRPGAYVYMQGAIQKGGSFYQEFRLVRPDGKIIWLSSAGYVEHDSQGRPRSITGINQDISDRKWRELFSLALDEINQIVHSTMDFDTILREAVSAAAKTVGCDTAALSLHKDNRWIVSATYGFPEDILGTEMDDTQEIHAVLAIKTRMPVAINDAFNDERVNREHMRKWGIRSVLVVPIFLKNEAVGALFLNYQHSTFEFQKAHLDFGMKFVASLSLALENARLFQDLKKEISERKRAEEALEKSNQALLKSIANERSRSVELEAIMDAVPAMIWISRDTQGREVIGNRFGNEFLRMRPGANISESAPEDALHDQPYRSYQNGREVPANELPIQVASATGKTSRNYAFDMVFKDGSTYHLIGNVNPLLNPEGKPAGAVGAFVDITELRRLQAEQIEARAEMEVQHRLMQNREQERQEIARDIHDGPIQTLVGTIFNLQFLKEAIHDRQMILELDQIGLSLKNAVRELREVVNELRPPALIHFGITRTIQMHAEDFREKHPELELMLELMEDQPRLPEQTCLTLFRIYQEALNNVFRHSEATRAVIRFSLDESQAVLEIEDNGRGFKMAFDRAEQTKKGHFGLAGMYERAEAAGGDFQVTSELGKGTHIKVRVPIRRN